MKRGWGWPIFFKLKKFHRWKFFVGLDPTGSKEIETFFSASANILTKFCLEEFYWSSALSDSGSWSGSLSDKIFVWKYIFTTISRCCCDQIWKRWGRGVGWGWGVVERFELSGCLKIPRNGRSWVPIWVETLMILFSIFEFICDEVFESKIFRNESKVFRDFWDLWSSNEHLYWCPTKS